MWCHVFKRSANGRYVVYGCVGKVYDMDYQKDELSLVPECSRNLSIFKGFHGYWGHVAMCLS